MLNFAEGSLRALIYTVVCGYNIDKCSGQHAAMLCGDTWLACDHVTGVWTRGHVSSWQPATWRHDGGPLLTAHRGNYSGSCHLRADRLDTALPGYTSYKVGFNYRYIAIEYQTQEICHYKCHAFVDWIAKVKALQFMNARWSTQTSHSTLQQQQT